MWRVILLGFCYHVLSQPLTDEPSTRHTRELIECCPCPASNQRASGHGGQDMLGRASDDCPCRFRSADSDGASSMFFPTRTVPATNSNSVPFMRSNDPKDDMKNLLEPEVGLAASMLETLREATEEEYRDAIARDAARAADAIPEESARNVVIIVKPRADEDDFVSEASNDKESRCIHSLGSSLGRLRTVSKPLKTLPDFLRLPKPRQPLTHRNLWDMDSNVGASNVQTSVIEMDGGALELEPRTNFFKLGTPLKQTPLKTSINNDGLKIPSIFNKLEESRMNRPNLFERFNLPLMPKFKVDNPLRKKNNEINTNNDSSPSPSIVQEFLEVDKEKGLFTFNKGPLMLKNLLKLKDVELIKKTVTKRPIFKSRLNNKESLSRDADDKCEDFTYDSAINEKVLMPKNVLEENEKFDATSVGSGDTNQKNVANMMYTEDDTQDIITSPSEIEETVLNSTETNTDESEEADCKNFSLEEIITSTTESISKALDNYETNETLDPIQESDIENITENQRNSNIDSFCETVEVLEKENEDLDTNSSDIIGNVIPFNEDTIFLPQLPEPGQETKAPSANDSEDLTNVKNADDETQITDLESRPSEISRNIIPKTNPILPLSETLSTIRDNVKKSIESLKKTTNNINSEKFHEDRKTETPITGNLNHNVAVKETDNFKSEVKEIPDQVTFKDLQKLSDDLLVLSSNKEQNFTPKDAEVADEINEPFGTELESLKAELTTLSDAVTPKALSIKPTVEKECRIGFDDSKTKAKTVQQSKSVSQDENGKDLSVEASAPTANILPALLDPLNLNEQLGAPLLPNLDPLNLSEKLRSPMFTDLDPLNLSEKLAAPLHQGIGALNLNENLFSDIDPINLNENLETSLLSNLDPLNVRSSLQDIIAKPSIPEDPLNLFGKPIIDVLKLPTLEDIRQRLSSVFDGNDRSAENNFSDEDGDCTNDAPEMAFAASTNNLRKLPALRPLEDLNVDLFQLNPLSSSQSDFLSKSPRLNLNNFRAKLPIPNNLDLKPVKLESRVANNKGNILGASLTFGHEKANSRKAKPNHSNLLGKPLGNLPTLDELRNTLHSGTHNLLGTPLQPNLDLFRNSNLGSSSFPDVDEIRRNAENTMKGLQQRMKSTFKGGQLHNPLGEKFARPQDFLEDANDKLKAIHYDLNDRLSSIHEDFLDQSRFKPLTSPSRIPFSSNPLHSNRNIMNTIRKPKVKPARLQTSASTLFSQEIDQFENTDNERSFMLPQARRNLKRIETNPHRTLIGSGSSPVPSKLELHKPKSSIHIPKKSLPALSRLPSLRQGAENLFSQNSPEKPLTIPRQPIFVKDLKIPILGKSSILGKPSPFKDKTSKVTITFATTTPNPVTTPVSKLRTTPPIKLYKPNMHIEPNGDSLKDKLASRPKTLDDAKQSASEFTTLRMSNPVKSKNNFKTANSEVKDLPQLQSLEPNEESKLRFSNLKGNKDSKLRVSENNWNRLNPDMAFNKNKAEMKKMELTKPLVWPKSGEDSFLVKVREAMQARLNSFSPGNAAEKAEVAKVQNIENADTDMTRSASENSDVVVVEEPLKENVSYKCKMVCERAK